MQERRLNPRYETTELQATVGGEPCEVLNLSLGGALLLTPRDRQTGDLLEVAFALPPASRPVVGRVVYVGPDGGTARQYRVGLAFGRLPRRSRESLQRLIDEHVV